MHSRSRDAPAEECEVSQKGCPTRAIRLSHWTGHLHASVASPTRLSSTVDDAYKLPKDHDLTKCRTHLLTYYVRVEVRTMKIKLCAERIAWLHHCLRCVIDDLGVAFRRSNAPRYPNEGEVSPSVRESQPRDQTEPSRGSPLSKFKSLQRATP